MTTKVTPEEREEIRNTASACGMTTSDFTRHRNLGYNPPATLSKEELEGLNNLGLFFGAVVFSNFNVIHSESLSELIFWISFLWVISMSLFHGLGNILEYEKRGFKTKKL